VIVAPPEVTVRPVPIVADPAVLMLVPMN
jgi:hypothetical protein